MAFNVWVIIWPNQKKTLGIIMISADEKASAAKKAMLFSRTNTLKSRTYALLYGREHRIFIDSFSFTKPRRIISGDAMKIEEYVPTKTPQIVHLTKPLITSPQKEIKQTMPKCG